MATNSLFAARRSRLRRGASGLLRRVARAMRRTPGRQVRVDEHTERAGAADGHQRLSLARARTVARWLTAHGGVAAERIVATGFGEDVLIARPPCVPGARRTAGS
jgi:outer membrane protein OmpA-like peptidoglycan-associated protein